MWKANSWELYSVPISYLQEVFSLRQIFWTCLFFLNLSALFCCRPSFSLCWRKCVKAKQQVYGVGVFSVTMQWRKKKTITPGIFVSLNLCSHVCVCLVMCLKSAVIASCWYWCQFARVSLMQCGVHVSKTTIKYILLPLSLPYLIFMSVIIIFNFNFMMAWHKTYELPGNEWKTLCCDISRFKKGKYLNSYLSEICKSS